MSGLSENKQEQKPETTRIWATPFGCLKAIENWGVTVFPEVHQITSVHVSQWGPGVGVFTSSQTMTWGYRKSVDSKIASLQPHTATTGVRKLLSSWDLRFWGSMLVGWIVYDCEIMRIRFNHNFKLDRMWNYKHLNNNVKQTWFTPI
jgi:hypothetical protein